MRYHRIQCAADAAHVGHIRCPIDLAPRSGTEIHHPNNVLRKEKPQRVDSRQRGIEEFSGGSIREEVLVDRRVPLARIENRLEFSRSTIGQAPIRVPAGPEQRADILRLRPSHRLGWPTTIRTNLLLPDTALRPGHTGGGNTDDPVAEIHE